MRLDRFLADMGCGTRSALKEAIRKGSVRVDGEIIRDPSHFVTAESSVTLGGAPLVYREHVYVLLNKPSGVLSATRDPKQPTVLDLLSDVPKRDLFPVGRLDKDTEGLLLITDDGALAHRLLSPKHHVEKEYYALLDGPVSEREIALFAEGISVQDDDPFRALPATLRILPAGNEVHLTICEGKFHQVKRMFAAVGRTVLFLRRVRMGPLTLDGLATGCCRELTAEEEALLSAL